MKPKHSSPDGFSAVELLVTVAIIAVIGAMALVTTQGTLANYRLGAAVSTATGAIQSTRYQAIMYGYPYNVTFSPASLSYQVAKKPTGTATFTNVGSAIPIARAGDVTINQTTTLQFNPNGTVQATAGALSFQIGNSSTSKTITVSGVGNVTAN